MSNVKAEARHRDAALAAHGWSESQRQTKDVKTWARDGGGRAVIMMRAESVTAAAIAATEQRVREECAAQLDALAALIDSEGDDANEHRKAHDCVTPQYLEGVADKSELDAQKLRALAERMRKGGGA